MTRTVPLVQRRARVSVQAFIKTMNEAFATLDKLDSCRTEYQLNNRNTLMLTHGGTMSDSAMQTETENK